MIVERAQIALGIRIEPCIEQLRDNRTLGFKRTRRQIHEVIEPHVKIRLVGCLVGDARHVDSHHAHRSGRLAAAKEPARLLAQLAQIQSQATAHAANIGRLHVGINVIAEIRRTVFAGHFKQKLVVLGFRPIEIARDGIRGDRILESAAFGVALDHDLDKRLVNQIHFTLTLSVCEAHLPRWRAGRAGLPDTSSRA